MQPDGAVTVTETIIVQAEGRDIRHGIYRDIPTSLPAGKSRQRSSLTIEAVRRDGADEEWRSEAHGEGVRIYLGQKDRDVPPGRHRYEIAYRMDRQVRFFGEFDELYWNVTGTGWAFPIDRAAALVELPAGTAALRRAGTTGPAGGRGQDWRARDEGGAIRFETTRPLPAREGLTIAVAFPKGAVAPPDRMAGAVYALRDFGPALIAGVGLLAVVGYFVWAWYRVGRDAPAGTVVPQFAPPKGVSPAAARFLMNMGYDSQALSAAIVSLAAKGHVTIRQTSGLFSSSFTLERRTGAAEPPARGEQRVLDILFPAGTQSIEVGDASKESFQTAESVLKEALSKEFERTHFLDNLPWFLGGAALSAVAVAALAAAGLNALKDGYAGLIAGVWIVATILTARGAWRCVRRATGPKGYVFAFVLGVLALLFTVAGIVMLAVVVVSPEPVMGLALAALAPVNLLFFHLLKAPTVVGRKVMDQLEGFRLYLSVAERERLAVLHPPEETPQLFERYLPYALALDVAHEWSQRFTGVLKAAGAADYHPSFWTGYDGALGDLGSSLAGTFSGAVSSASATSSGSGGGGFSGGGGGGGGGGGW